MAGRSIFHRLAGFGLAGVTFLAACNATVSPVAPAGVTATLLSAPVQIVTTATFTASPAETATTTDTPNPTAAASLTATPTVALSAQVIPSLNAYCRKGPGTNYDQITFLQSGTAYKVLGRNSLNSWWLVQAPGNISCWMGDANATKQGPVEQAAIALVPPLPVTPPTFVDTYTCNLALKTLTVSFNWSAVQNVTGYRIYRNGNPLTELGPSASAYHDDAPLELKLVYELEAFNDFGVANRISVTVPACQ